MQPGDLLTLRIDKPVAGGRMLARHDRMVALVSAAIPGEVVEARVERIQRGTIWAQTCRIVEPSPDRVEPFCDWACGGSVYAHIGYERQLQLKRDVIDDAFARLAKVPLESAISVMPSPTDGYRMRARLHVRDRRIGFFREGTHEMCEAGPTRQLLPQTIAAVERLATGLERSERARVTDIAISENCDATERACHLDLAAEGDPSQLAAATEVEGFIGASCSGSQHARALMLWGSPSVTDDFVVDPSGRGQTLQFQLTRQARAFFQGNRYLIAQLLARVVTCVPPGSAVDLYAGVGLFSIALGARGDTKVMAVEGDPVSAADLRQNALPHTATVAARHQSVETFVARAKPGAADTVIVDPPRTGMTKEALVGAVRLKPGRMVYVSCDVATLARDSRLLIDAGYRLAALEAFDLFPNTAHVETLAVFDRS